MAAMTVPIRIHVIGDSTGDTYIGDFGVKPFLSHRDILQRDAVRRELLGVSPEFASEEASARATAFGELRVRIVSYPPWWEACGLGLDLLDENVIIELYEECLRVENEARAKKIEEGDKALAALKAGE